MKPDTHTIKLTEGHRTYRDLKAPADPDVSEGLKLSNLAHVEVYGAEIHGGYEDCIDVVRGSDVTFIGSRLVALPDKGTRTFVTIKGGVDGWTLYNIALKGRTRWPWDISIGDHTIYKTGPCRGGTVGKVYDEDNPNRRITILCLYADKPMLLAGNYRVINVPNWLVKLVWRLVK